MSSDKILTQRSKFLSLFLRHRPEVIGLQLGEGGWVEVAELLEKLAKNGKPLSRDELEEVVATNNKKRFAFSEDGMRIRANQGHSVEVELGYKPVQPPEHLFHGTAQRNLDSIRQKGLTKRNRHHVHLSLEKETAINVGGRHGKAVVLTIKAGDMHREGHLFYCSENGVWLAEAIPPEYLIFPV